jgi:hypothetical protein
LILWCTTELSRRSPAIFLAAAASVSVELPQSCVNSSNC